LLSQFYKYPTQKEVIFIKWLLKNTERRQLELVETLYYSYDPIPLNDLARVLDCSTKILKDDLNLIHSVYPFVTIIQKSNLVNIQFGPYAGIDAIYQNLFTSRKYIFPNPYVYFL